MRKVLKVAKVDQVGHVHDLERRRRGLPAHVVVRRVLIERAEQLVVVLLLRRKRRQVARRGTKRRRNHGRHRRAPLLRVEARQRRRQLQEPEPAPPSRAVLPTPPRRQRGVAALLHERRHDRRSASRPLKRAPQRRVLRLERVGVLDDEPARSRSPRGGCRRQHRGDVHRRAVQQVRLHRHQLPHVRHQPLPLDGDERRVRREDLGAVLQSLPARPPHRQHAAQGRRADRMGSTTPDSSPSLAVEAVVVLERPVLGVESRLGGEKPRVRHDEGRAHLAQAVVRVLAVPIPVVLHQGHVIEPPVDRREHRGGAALHQLVHRGQRLEAHRDVVHEVAPGQRVHHLRGGGVRVAPRLQHQPPRVLLLRGTVDLGRRLHHAHLHEAQLGDVPLHLVLDLLALAQGAEVLRRAIGAGWQAPGAGAPGPSDELVPRRGWDPWPAVHASLPIRPVTTTGASPSCNRVVDRKNIPSVRPFDE